MPETVKKTACPPALMGLLIILDLLFLASLLALPLAWVFDPFKVSLGPLDLTLGWGVKAALVPFLLIAFRSLEKHALSRRHTLRPALLDRPWMKNAVLAVASMYLWIALVEGVLLVTGFNLDMPPVVFQLEDEEGKTEVSSGYADPELLWKFRIGENYHRRKINSLGYRDREVDRQKASGTTRVICMGDSVTAQGDPPYSQDLHELLTETPPVPGRWEAFNMAVYGYSSVQGLRVFQLQTRYLQPDIVTLYFGWNDHWLEMKTDRSRMAVRSSPLYGKAYNLLKEKRFFMLLRRLSGVGRSTQRPRSEPGFRVPPGEYREVMTEFIKEIRAVGALPLVITAPRRKIRGVKEKYPGFNEKIDFDTVHDEYTELTRQVAAEQGADLLDLDRKFLGDEYDEHFKDDGIHFTQRGLELIAAEIYAKISEMSGK